MSAKIQVRRDTAANWAAANPTLLRGEIGFEYDTVKVKIGDGSTAYNSLAYAVVSQTMVEELIADHADRTDNPHSVTKAQVGLGNVSNLAPADLPVSTATQSALDLISTETQAALALKYDASNPDGFIDATEATALQLQAFIATKEPTGHENRTQSTVNFDEVTRTFSISPVSTHFDIWIAGVKQSITSTLSVQIPDTTANYFFYIDVNGALQYQASFDISLFEGKVYTGFVHWNAADNQAVVWGEERHGIVMDGATHSYLHTTRGTQLVSGGAITFAIGNGSSNSDAQVGVADLRIRDEDIQVNIAHAATPSAPFQQVLYPIAEMPILYREGTEWKRATPTQYPVLTGTNRAKFNEYTGTTWQLTEASQNGKVLITYVFATSDFRTPVFGILGQAEYASIDEAKALGGWDQITFGDLPAQELKLLHILYYSTSSAYANTPKAAIEAVIDARFTADRQVSASSFNGDHSNLSGLSNDDHTQYLNETRGDARYYTKTESDGAFEPKNVNIQSHIASTSNPHLVTKAQIGLGSVDNVSAASLRDRGTHTGTQLANTISDFTTAVDALVSSGISTHTSAVDPHPQYETSTEAQSKVDAHANLTNNPHSVTKAQVGLGLVDNVSAASLRDRSTHTGTQTASTISDFSTAVDSRISLQKGQPNGLSTLDANGKQPIAENPVGSAVSISTATVNAQGTASTLALSDHTHAVSVGSSETNSTTAATTTSLTDTLLTGMTLTPAAGTYLALFSAGGITHGTNSATITFSIYSGGSLTTGTQRVVIPRVSNTAFTHAAASQCVVTVNGSQAIEARWATSGGTATCGTRSLTLVKLA